MTAADEQSYFPPFRTDRALVLTPFPNGGWIVTQAGVDQREWALNLGAFTNAEAMLAALEKNLVPTRKENNT